MMSAVAWRSLPRHCARGMANGNRGTVRSATC
jgi:hypothetical protein